MPNAPLSGRKVIELGTMLAAPFASHILAQLGAEVIKVEPPRGDPTRSLVRGGPSGTFIAYSHGKKSVCIDLAHPDGHAAGLERIQDLGVGAMTFPAAGSAADLALLLCDHHGASLIVTAGHTASIEEFFDRSRQRTNPSTFLTRLKVGEKLVDAKAVATLYRSRVSGGAIALLVLAMLIAVIAALWVSRADVAVLDWIADYWNRFSLWVQGWVT